MTYLEIDIWTVLITCVVLAIMYTGTLVKVCTGTRYKTILWIAALLLASTPMYFINIFALEKTNSIIDGD